MRIIIQGTHNTKGKMDLGIARDRRELHNKIRRLDRTGEFRKIWYMMDGSREQARDLKYNN